MGPWWLPVLLVAAAVPWALPRGAGPWQGRRGAGGGEGVRGSSAGHQVGAASTGTRSPIGRWWRRRAGPDVTPGVDVAVLADILGAAIDSGASIPAALGALGRAVPGAQGEQFVRVAATLGLGGSWSAAWTQAEPQYQVLARALQPAWEDGVAPGALLTHAATQIRRRRTEAAREAAARLGVRLVLPMGLCWLPAFVLLGLAPVLLSTGGALWP